MDGPDIKVKYLSVGANRFTAVADWHGDGTLAFGADGNVCLWRPTDPVPKGVTKILSGHTSHVRAVKFLPTVDDDRSTYLVTGGDDRSVRVWRLGPEERAEIACICEHTAAVNCIGALAVPVRGTSRRIFASGGADAMVKLWSFESGQVTLLQTIRTSSKYLPLAISLGELGEEGDAFLLAVAGTTSVIQIFVATRKESENDGIGDFTLQATLSGHENWVRSLDVIPEKNDEPGSDLILASASQDKYIRLWRIRQGTAASTLGGALATDAAVDALMMPGNKAHRLKAGSASYGVMFEALLLGHEDWIYSARWNRAADGTLQLLSASADNSLAIWEADAGSGIWITNARLGEVSREKGATTATGSTGGFWTGLWSPAGTSVVTLGRTGSWRRWDYHAEDDRWAQNMAVSGHTRAVTGLAWAPSGAYLLSTSADQTTRLHAEWAGPGTWHEMARPQIHGYDLNCVDTLDDACFVSGADEKLMRVFTMPRAVAKMLRRLGGRTGGDDDEDDKARLNALPDAASMPVLGLSNKAVDAPTRDDAGQVDDDADLAFMKKERQRQEEQEESAAPIAAPAEHDDPSALLDPSGMVRRAALAADHPPFEESLSRHTLWPEADKLYGHGYELSCLAASRDGRLVASACRASSATHAVIRVFERTADGGGGGGVWAEQRPPLAAHALTCARLRFAPPADDLLLSVGRDRQWAVFAREGGGGGGGGGGTPPASPASGFRLLQASPKAHVRMILDAAWAPPARASCRVFATAGRDKQVKIWAGRSDGPGAEGRASTDRLSFELAATVTPDEHPVTALDFLPRLTADGRLVLAVGTEAGTLLVLTLDVGDVREEGGVAVAVASSRRMPPPLCLPKAVLQLAWRPVRARREEEERGGYEDLAVAGEDGSVRIYSVFVEQSGL